MAALAPRLVMPRPVQLPRVLDEVDAAHYARIFALQEAGDWAAADRAVEALRDQRLLGHVLAQRYLDRRYRASYPELASWLAAYADHPAAHPLFALARKRRPAGVAAPATPVGAPLELRGIGEEAADLRPARAGNGGERVTALRHEIRLLAKAAPDSAERLLRRLAAERSFDAADLDGASADLAEGYLFAGDARKALFLMATPRTPAFRPLTHWQAGLAAWRLGRLDEARRHFETLARLPDQSSWTVAAAAFWAARIHLRNHRPDLVDYWLSIAAERPRTFYGLLARRLLGEPVRFNFEPETFADEALAALHGSPAAQRALALVQLGRFDAAELELRTLANEAPVSLYPALVALADLAQMPALSMQLAARLAAIDGRRHDHALYPLAHWEPPGGFAVDRALVFALVRQESQFIPDAESASGAVGLMQLMPATAESVADRAGIALRHPGKPGHGIAEPQVNLALGQAFLQQLLGSEQIRGNLILMLAAYNGGPGNLPRWRARLDVLDDPLLFIETLPTRETRIFVERVLTNYWVYRLRLGQPTHDLDMLARGAWPIYVAFDGLPDEVTRHAEAR